MAYVAKTGCDFWVKFGVNKASTEQLHEIQTSLSQVKTLDELGNLLVAKLSGAIAFDRFNIGLIDTSRNVFHDAFVVGNNVPGRTTGHQRTLVGTVVEKAIDSGDGYYFGDSNLAPWLEIFPGFAPVFESGIRSMLAVPVREERDHREVLASLVFASRDARAYEPSSLSLATAVTAVLPKRLLRLV